jgi:hypothetical protein
MASRIKYPFRDREEIKGSKKFIAPRSSMNSSKKHTIFRSNRKPRRKLLPSVEIGLPA